MSLGTAIFDMALVGYPLYLTSKNLTSLDPSVQELTKMLNFWLVFGTFGITEQCGITFLPGYYLLKCAILLTLCSDLYSPIVSDMAIKRFCHQYLKVSEKAIVSWNQRALPQVEKIDRQAGGWLSSGRHFFTSWWTTKSE
jgi:hypothetical protein